MNRELTKTEFRILNQKLDLVRSTNIAHIDYSILPSDMVRKDRVVFKYLREWRNLSSNPGQMKFSSPMHEKSMQLVSVEYVLSSQF